MAKERGLKKSFQDSLEDIKERMMEKRNKKLAKVAVANKVISTKVKTKILNNSAVMMKNFQVNNRALALALEEEKIKMKQAQDVILCLKREYQALVFKTLVLRRKLNLQQSSESAESKLANLREIIGKVTQNLLETANLLGPAQDLCSTDPTTRPVHPSGEKECLELPAAKTVLHKTVPRPEAKIVDVVTEMVVAEHISPSDAKSLQSSENGNPSKRISRGRRYVCQSNLLNVSEDEMQKEGTGDESLRNVSIRRRRSTLRRSRGESSFVGILSPPGHSTLDDLSQIHGENEQTGQGVPLDDLRLDSVVVESAATDKCPFEDQTDLELSLAPLDTLAEVKSSTPQTRPKPAARRECAGRERGRKGKTDGPVIAPLKRPWENSKQRARSKSRERGTGKQIAAGKEKLDISVCSNDAYDFVAEESIHITPFRQGRVPEESVVAECQSSSSDETESEEDDSVYVPYSKKARNRLSLEEEKSPAAPLRPRSKRQPAKAQQQFLDEKENKKNVKSAPKSGVVTAAPKKNKKSVGSKGKNGNGPIETQSVVGKNKPDADRAMGIVGGQKCKSPRILESITVAEVFSPKVVHSALAGTPTTHKQELRLLEETLGVSLTPRFGLRDLTNFSGSSGGGQSRKISCPIFTVENKDPIAMDPRKRRCTVTVSYKEPTLNGKLRRGDRFTDTEFLSSPIFKHKDSKRKSFMRKSLTRYNEAFVGCR